MGRRKQLYRFLIPGTIAVIGASASETKPGGMILRRLVGSGRRLYPVNPREDQIAGHKVVPDINSLPGDIDLAIVALSASSTVDAVRSCLKKKISNFIIVAGGFSEIGEKGKRIEDELASLAREYDLNILGPNSLGIFLPDENIDTIFVEHGDSALGKGGTISCVVQSGSFGTEAIGYASVSGYGMRAFVGLGNKCDLDECDFIEFFGEDKQTKCIGFYLESIERGRMFLDQAQKIAINKPVVVLKAGNTETAVSAVSSHTGKLAGSDSIVSGAFSQFGIQRVYDDEHFCDATKVLSMIGSTCGNRIAVLTAAGGYGVMFTDQIEKNRCRPSLEMAKLSEKTRNRIKKQTFPFASCNNPVDITASADDHMYAECLDALIQDQGVDIIICVAFFSPPGFSKKLVDMISKKASLTDKPVLVFTNYGPYTGELITGFYDSGVVAFPSISRTVRAAKVLVERCGIEKQLYGKAKTGTLGKTSSPALDKLVKWHDGLCMTKRPDEFDAKQLMKLYGIKTPESRRCGPGEEFNAQGIKAPYVIKVCSNDINHKTEHDGVILNVTRSDLNDTLSQMRKKFPGKDILVEEQVAFTGPEFIIGLICDPVFGYAVMVGAGGILTEVYEDTAFRLAPCSIADAVDMIKELMIAPVFDGFRGMNIDSGKLARKIARLSNMPDDFQNHLHLNITHLDINPIVWSGSDWVVLDAKLNLD